MRIVSAASGLPICASGAGELTGAPADADRARPKAASADVRRSSRGNEAGKRASRELSLLTSAATAFIALTQGFLTGSGAGFVVAGAAGVAAGVAGAGFGRDPPPPPGGGVVAARVVPVLGGGGGAPPGVSGPRTA